MKALPLVLLSCFFIFNQHATVLANEVDVDITPSLASESSLKASEMQLYLKAISELFKGDFAAAELTNTRILDGKPDDFSALNRRAQCRFELGEYRECIADCSKTLSICPNYIEAMQLKAKALRRMGQIEEAVACELSRLDIEAAEIERKRKALREEAENAKRGIYVGTVTFGSP